MFANHIDILTLCGLVMSIPNSMRRVLFGTTSFWGVLGFYRGIDHYEYDYENDMNDYNKKMKKWEKDNRDYVQYGIDIPIKPTKYYLTGISYGFTGTASYFNIFFGFNIPKELYRLEVNLRSLDDEKQKPYYRKVYP
jgi:hypothetical protein